MSQSISSKVQGALELDFKRFLQGLGKLWWKALICCVLAAVAGSFISDATYVPRFTSHTTFVVSNKSTGEAPDNNGLTISDISASNALANTFKYILLSDEALGAVIQTYGLDMSVERLKGCVTISPIPNTNVLEMSVVTGNAELSKNIAEKIIDYYPDVLERTLKTASLEVLNAPRSSQAADSYYGYITYPVIGFAVSAFLVTVYVYLKLLLQDTIKAVSDVEGRLGMTVLATIPKIRLTGRKKNLLMTDQSNGFTFMEAYKALRTRIELIAEKKGYKTYVVTSALENEGKTTTAINLAAALAANGRKVLLIDADLKNPSVHTIISQLTGQIVLGLNNVLRGDASYESAVKQIKELGIYVLPNVTEVPDSSELLSSHQMKDLIIRAAQSYDFVIIDTPPAGIMTDAAVIATYADAVLLALRQDHATARSIESAVMGLSDHKAEIIGCVFNIVDSHDIGYGNMRYSKYRRYGKNYPSKHYENRSLNIIRRMLGK